MSQRSVRGNIICVAAAQLSTMLTEPFRRSSSHPLHGVTAWNAGLRVRRVDFETCISEPFPIHAEDSCVALRLGVREASSRLLRKPIGTLQHATRSTTALLAGTEAIATPPERVQTLLQLHERQDKLTNTYQAFKAQKCHGVGECYRGLIPVLFCSGFSNVPFSGLRGPIREHLPTANLTVLIWAMSLSVEVYGVPCWEPHFFQLM